MSGYPDHPHLNIEPDENRDWRPSVKDPFPEGRTNLLRHEYASPFPQDGYAPHRPPVDYRYVPPHFQYYYAEETYPAAPPPGPSAPGQSGYGWTSRSTSYPERPPGPHPAAGPPDIHDEGYESEESDGADRCPSPEEDTRGSPTQENVVKPMGPRQSRERKPTDGKPFVLMGCVLDPFDLAENILDFSIYAYGSGSLTTARVRRFVENLTAYGVGLRGIEDIKYFCEERKIRREWPKAEDDIKPHSEKAEKLNARIQDLISDCEKAMPRHCRHGDGALKQDACLRFVHTMLARKVRVGAQEVRATDLLTRAMHHWRNRYNEGCAQLQEDMEKLARRIERDRRRREEDKRRREEDDRRREEHSQKRLVYRHRRHH